MGVCRRPAWILRLALLSGIVNAHPRSECSFECVFLILKKKMVGTGGFEPPTLAVSGRCSPTELRAFSGPVL